MPSASRSRTGTSSLEVSSCTVLLILRPTGNQQAEVLLSCILLLIAYCLFGVHTCEEFLCDNYFIRNATAHKVSKRAIILLQIFTDLILLQNLILHH